MRKLRAPLTHGSPFRKLCGIYKAWPYEESGEKLRLPTNFSAPYSPEYLLPLTAHFTWLIKGQSMPLKYSHSNLYLAVSWHSISCSCFCDCLTNHEFQAPGPLTEVTRMHEKKTWLVIWKCLVKCRLPRGCIFSHSSHSFLYWKTVLPGKFPWRFLTFLLYKSLYFSFSKIYATLNSKSMEKFTMRCK